MFSGRLCVCASGHPFGIICELAHSWITTDPEVAVFGYVCLVSKTHAVEPFELSEAEQTAFWGESMAVARELSRLLRPVKLNYEIHGNTLPHLHVLPRQTDDPFVGRPLDLKAVHHRYTTADIERLRAMLVPLSSSGPRRQFG